MPSFERDCEYASTHARTIQSLTPPFLQAATHPVGADFTWAEAYLLDTSSRRLDLRHRTQPLHTRLSRAVAGSDGDDVLDISIVRRDWVEQVAAKEASSGNVKHLKCVIPSGVFCVPFTPLQGTARNLQR